MQKATYIDLTYCRFFTGFCLDNIYFDLAFLPIVFVKQIMSFSACYKAANDNLCSTKQLTPSSLTLSFLSLSFFLISHSAHRFTPQGYMTVAYGKHKSRTTVKKRLKEWMKMKRSKRGTSIVVSMNQEKKEKKRRKKKLWGMKRDSVWCGLDWGWCHCTKWTHTDVKVCLKPKFVI